jgi:lipid A 4'-phosphatase
MPQDKTLTYLIAACVACGLIFTLFPQIDLWTSALFYDGSAFPFENSSALQTLREAIWTLTLLVPLCLLALSVAGLVLRPVRAAICLGPLAFMLLGPGLVVNGILKAHWGRARPADVTEFGGLAQFTPPLTITDQCLRNCSFVSGEAAGIVAASLVIFYLLARHLSPKTRRALTLALVTLSIIGAGMRVTMGRHFLSDVIFAALFMALLFRLMLPLFSRLEARFAGGWCLLPKRP